MPQKNFESPRLLVDVGGTYARFALEVAAGKFEHKASLRCADYADFQSTVTAYLARLPVNRIRNSAVAIANPVAGDLVRMTNYHWQFSIEEMRERLRFDRPRGGQRFHRAGDGPAAACRRISDGRSAAATPRGRAACSA